MVYRKTPPRQTSGAWTLAEMLAILGVLSCLMAVIVPAMQGMSHTSSRSASVSQVMSLVDQARSLALTQGRSSYLVVADANVALYLEAEDPSEPPVPVSRWIAFPAGHHFQDDPGVPSLFTAAQESSPPQFRPPGENTARPLPYFKFNPAGGVAHPGQSQYARLILTSKKGPSDLISVALFTGRPKCQPAP